MMKFVIGTNTEEDFLTWAYRGIVESLFYSESFCR